MDIPDKYKVEHLFLLIGENPLPNYVAAKLLFKEGKKKTLYLIHTTGTSETAERLQEILESDIEVQLVSINDNDSDAHEIRKVISEELENIKLDNNEKIGLNYTGGTKAMSVHSYRSLFYQEQNSQYIKRSNIVLSYLDARRLEMCFDREDGESDRYKVTPEMLEVNLKTIFELHGWKFKSEPVYQPKLFEATKALTEFFQEKTWSDVWQNWCKEVFKYKDKNDNDREKRRKDKDIMILQFQPIRVEIYEGFNAIKNVINLEKEEPKNFLESIKNKGQFKKLEKLGKWLDGEWLEHYVLQQVINISEELSIHDQAASFHVSTTQNPKDNKFEFDVSFMRGYQLFAISCTTDSTKPLCKSKLFEAYIRAQQLGGSEARVALVCCVDVKTVDRLKTEITNVFNPDPESSKKDYRLEVFGREDLIDLSTKIKTWIKNVDKEAK
ncbi:MAG: DUF1887 family protein [Okeania sp. SIO3I5]|uniref:Card1-like endonuclease domain-containing protein n=1 Tax=Okeania sp. SIO3I5 TaxID=2607805 RepID=UPI0013BE88D3|nr:DUF1887 family CARF protein [Okeania sp. SIO3I5]NEQ36898.1 DUF1887 family protein [Okeania sp. SIO3I5]